MRPLVDEDLRAVTSRVPISVLKFMNELEVPGVYLAGGLIRSVVAGERVQGVDVFVNSQETADRLIEHLRAQGGPDPYETDFATSFSLGRTRVQVIRWDFYPNPRRVVEAFDFTVCQAVVWRNGEEWQSLCGNEFYPDLAARRLRPAPELSRDRAEIEAAGSLFRMLKYTARGYRASRSAVARLVADAARASDFAPSEEEFERRLEESLRGLDPSPEEGA